MESVKAIITSPTGVHARPAGELVKMVKALAPTVVTLVAAGRSVNAASMLSVLSLGLKNGTEVEVRAEGSDEKSAAQAVAAFLESINE